MTNDASIAADGIEFTDVQRSTRSLVRDFVDNEIVPHASRWDRSSEFPRDLFSRLGALNLMGITMPEELGGAGADYLTQTLAVEEFARGDAGVGTTVVVHSASTAVLYRNGTEEQRQRWIPKLASAEELAAFALTEPGAGSDVRALRATATQDRISGTKQWVSNGSFASRMTVFARDDQAAGELSAFAVEASASGLAVTREEEKMGLHSSSTADIVFDDTPGEVLGARGAGLKIALSTVGGGRISIAAVAVGIAQAAFEMATSYAAERTAFGRPIGAFQAIQHKLADMQTEISAARALTHRAARLRDAGRPHAFEASQAKLFASGVARRQTGEALQVLGGVGYTKEFPAERYYRDAKITEIYEGTSEIQRLVISREILGDIVSI